MSLVRFLKDLLFTNNAKFEARVTTNWAVLTLDSTCRIVRRSPRPQVLSITFTRGDSMAALKGNVQLSPVNPAEQISSRPVSIEINGAAGPTVDMNDPSVTFDCNEGDAIVATPTGDVNSTGTGPAGPPFSTTATLGLPLPTAPTVVGITFVAA